MRSIGVRELKQRASEVLRRVRDPHHAVSTRWLAGATSAEGLLAAPALLLPEVTGPIARVTGSARLRVHPIPATPTTAPPRA